MAKKCSLNKQTAMRIMYSTVMMYAIMVVAALSLSACGGGNEDDNDGNNDGNIIGVWKCVDYDSKGLFGNSTLDVGDFLYINEDYTYLMKQYRTDNVLDKGQWLLRDNKLMIDSDFPNIMTTTFSVIKLNSSTLTITWKDIVTLSFRRVNTQ